MSEGNKTQSRPKTLTEEALALVAPFDGVCDYPGCKEDATEENLSTNEELCARHADKKW